MITPAPITHIRYSRKSGGAWRLASRRSHQAVRPLSTNPLRRARPAMMSRKAVRWIMTKADALTARMPRGVRTPSVRSTYSRKRREGSLVPGAAGLCPPGLVAGVERVAARARVNRVRVVDREPGPHKAVEVIDLGAADVGGAEVVDHDLHAVLVDGDVLGPGE